jgi:hypothetical protein
VSCCTAGGFNSAIVALTVCPSCETVGSRVEPLTLKALLTPEGLRRGVPREPRFCATRDCPVVYFDSACGAIFTERDLTVLVHAKHPDALDVPVCYCFGVTPASMEAASKRDGATAVRDMITREVKAGHCACEVRNPTGRCCLGDVVRVENARRRGAVSKEE